MARCISQLLSVSVFFTFLFAIFACGSVSANGDFSLTTNPTEIPMLPGTTAAVDVSLHPISGFQHPVTMTLSGLPYGLTASVRTFTLTPAAPQKIITVTSASNAAPRTATLTLTGVWGAITHTVTFAVTIGARPNAPDVPTYHYGNGRNGANFSETILTTANVNSATFGKVGFFPVDGKVDAQPLYINALPLPKGSQNVLYVATEHNSVYALNAITGAQIWKVSLTGLNETTSDPRSCSQISPEIGITSTPVIDRSRKPNGAIFVVAMTKDKSGIYHQRFHALDLITGAELPGSPTEVQATYPGAGANSQNGSVIFDPKQYAERAGLLLLNGTIYTAWTSHCDIQPYTGWVMGYSEQTLRQTTVLNLTPNGSEGSVWMAGYGLTADTLGNIYLADANGTFDRTYDANGFPTRGDYGNAMLKLSTVKGQLAVKDYFQPFNTISESSADEDLGSGGAMILPDEKDSTGRIRHLLVATGKDGNIYLADRDNMGKFNQKAANNTNLYQEIPKALPHGAWSGPAFFNNTLYYAGVDDVLKAFAVTNAKLSTTPQSESSVSFAYPGSTPSVSAHGTQNGIVWALLSDVSHTAVLYAFDATNLAHELYNSSQAAAGRDSFGTGNKFLTPMVVNGHVYVGTPNGVAVFGLLKH